MNAPTDLALTTPTTDALQPREAFTTLSVMTNPALMQQAMAFADVMSKGVATVPKHLRGKPSDCLAVVMQAMRWNMDPFAVAQKTMLVNDVLGYEAQLVIAAVQNSGAITGTFKYEWDGTGQDMKCRAGAVLRGDSAITWGPWLRNGDVTTRNSPLWKTNPAQQLGYRQAANWARLFAPGAILGVYTPDEIDPSIGVPVNMGAAQVVGADAGTETVVSETLKAAREAADKGRAHFADWWRLAKPEQRRELKDEVVDLQRRCDKADAERTIDATTSTSGASATDATKDAKPVADPAAGLPDVGTPDPAFVAAMDAAEKGGAGA